MTTTPPPTPNARGPLPNGTWLIPVPDAADLLGTSDTSLRGRIKMGTIAHRRNGGRLWMLWPDDINAALDDMYQPAS